MGCCPLGKKVSEAFGKCSGREERRSSSRAVKLSPPPAYLYSRPTTTVIKSVNFSNDTPIVIIPPDPNPPKPRPVENPAHQYPISATTTTSAAAAAAASAPAKPVTMAEPSNVVSSPAKGPVQKEPGPVQKEPGPVQRGPPHCYVMSPLPRWEERARRREYLSGEYSYYPTPIREGIYNIGTDPNRLTSIFSEENPNACTIV